MGKSEAAKEADKVEPAAESPAYKEKAAQKEVNAKKAETTTPQKRTSKIKLSQKVSQKQMHIAREYIKRFDQLHKVTEEAKKNKAKIDAVTAESIMKLSHV